jgi:hypothetical protein
MRDSRFIEKADFVGCPNIHAQGNTVESLARLSSRQCTFVGLVSLRCFR